MKKKTCYKDPKTGKWKVDRDYQRERSRIWRQRWYALGYTYKRIDGHWGWVKKNPTTVRARIHSDDHREIELLRRKIQMAMRKEGKQ